MLKEKTNVEPSVGELHLLQRQRLTDRHLYDMENIIKMNSNKKKFWILGKAKIKRKFGRTSIRPLLKALDYMPEVQKESYLYEIDNIKGTRELLWVMHPNNKLSMPTIGKSIRVADETA